MINERARWRARPEGLRFGGSLAISFQRYLLVDASPLPAIPKSLGALGPAGAGHGRFVIALHPGEAVWLALEFGTDPPPVAIEALSGPERCTWRFDAPRPGAMEMIAGAPDAGTSGRRFAAEDPHVSAIEIIAGLGAREVATVELVDPERFEERTGRAAPRAARREEGYGGWRLP